MFAISFVQCTVKNTISFLLHRALTVTFTIYTFYITSSVDIFNGISLKVAREEDSTRGIMPFRNGKFLPKKSSKRFIWNMNEENWSLNLVYKVCLARCWARPKGNLEPPEPFWHPHAEPDPGAPMF